MTDKLEMRVMLAGACHEGIMDWRMVKNGKDSTKCWFFTKTEVKEEGKKNV